MSFLETASRLFEGSSRMRMSGEEVRARARRVFCF